MQERHNKATSQGKIFLGVFVDEIFTDWCFPKYLGVAVFFFSVDYGCNDHQ